MHVHVHVSSQQTKTLPLLTKAQRFMLLLAILFKMLYKSFDIVVCDIHVMHYALALLPTTRPPNVHVYTHTHTRTHTHTHTQTRLVPLAVTLGSCFSHYCYKV